MKHFTAALLVASGVWSSRSAHAGALGNDLYLGFQNQANNGTADYILNLGPASGIVGGSTVVDLSSDFSLADFNAVLNGSDSMFGGVAGGDSTPKDIYATQLRSGGSGNPAVAGSSAPTELSSGAYAQVFTAFAQINAPATGKGILDAGLSWENYVEPALTGNSFYGNSGINPDSVVSAGEVLYEDLWFDAPSGNAAEPFTYKGYFTLDLTGSTPKLTFTPAAAAGSLTSPVISKVSKSVGTTTLIWSTVSTHTYQLQYTASLSPTNWMNIGSAVTATGTTMTNSDTTAGSSPQRFYRIQAQ